MTAQPVPRGARKAIIKEQGRPAARARGGRPRITADLYLAAPGEHPGVKFIIRLLNGIEKNRGFLYQITDIFLILCGNVKFPIEL